MVPTLVHKAEQLHFLNAWKSDTKLFASIQTETLYVISLTRGVGRFKEIIQLEWWLKLLDHCNQLILWIWQEHELIHDPQIQLVVAHSLEKVKFDRKPTFKIERDPDQCI
jgi:hypothetical protein